MQRDDLATKVCEIETKFSYPVAKLRLDFFVNFEPWVTTRKVNKQNKQAKKQLLIIYKCLSLTTKLILVKMFQLCLKAFSLKRT